MMMVVMEVVMEVVMMMMMMILKIEIFIRQLREIYFLL